MALEKAYNCLTHNSPSFSAKADSGAKFGVHPEPVCFPPVLAAPWTWE